MPAQTAVGRRPSRTVLDPGSKAPIFKAIESPTDEDFGGLSREPRRRAK